VSQLKSELSGQAPPDMIAIEQLLAEKTNLFKTTDETWRKLEERNNQLQGVKAKLAKASEKNTDLEAQYAIYGTLSDVAGGQTGNKISLQRFVLSVLLDDVLIQASARLNLMSKGRYQLVRKEDRSKGNKASGLDLEVEDGYSGKTRPVATLSGGESFMAALSLALGLSDVVQSYAGGIKLDTLFIDEGFGSLDPESLDLAIKTLIDLQANGRMIGIISHVSELKEQMALRLDVVSSRSGSTIRTITA
jgi:exonuclease SbcC